MLIQHFTNGRLSSGEYSIFVLQLLCSLRCKCTWIQSLYSRYQWLYDIALEEGLQCRGTRSFMDHSEWYRGTAHRVIAGSGGSRPSVPASWPRRKEFAKLAGAHGTLGTHDTMSLLPTASDETRRLWSTGATVVWLSSVPPWLYGYHNVCILWVPLAGGRNPHCCSLVC